MGNGIKAYLSVHPDNQELSVIIYHLSVIIYQLSVVNNNIIRG